MRFSISTKVFFGFVVVILTFGFSSLYNSVRTSQLGDTVVFLRREIFPLKEQFLGLEATLRVYYTDVLVNTRRPDALELVRDRLPQLQPYRTFQELLTTISAAVQSDNSSQDNDSLLEFSANVEHVHASTSLYETLEAESAASSRPRALLAKLPARLSNAELFEWIAKDFAVHVNERRYDQAAERLSDLRWVLQDLRRDTKDLGRKLTQMINQSSDRAEQESARALLAAILTTSGSILIGIIVMLLTQSAIKRIRYLGEGVRRVSQGDYAGEVRIRGGDEIGALADEFNKMAKSLRDRDQMLALQREELLRAERLATIGKMSAQITHEIRNPLSSIGLNTELLEEELANNTDDFREARELLRSIGQEVGRLADVTEQYLRFARMPQADLHIESLNNLATHLGQFVQEDLNQRGIHLSVELEAIPNTLFDANQIRQALLNLIRNAAEAMPHGGAIEITTGQTADYVWVQVRDWGEGIPDEQRERIFDPFFSTKMNGTGLGLALVQQIVAEHGGNIVCEKAPGGGTLFRLELPIIMATPAKHQ